MNQIKRQSAVNYYERLDEKTSESVKSRKTAVERLFFTPTHTLKSVKLKPSGGYNFLVFRVIEISHTLEEKRQETWQKWIQRITGCEAAVENSSKSSKSPS